MCPGVTSFCAVAARLGRSLTRMDEPLHILPGSAELDNALALPGTKVIMKSGKAIHDDGGAGAPRYGGKTPGWWRTAGWKRSRSTPICGSLPEEISYFATIVAD